LARMQTLPFFTSIKEKKQTNKSRAVS